MGNRELLVHHEHELTENPRICEFKVEEDRLVPVPNFLPMAVSSMPGKGPSGQTGILVGRWLFSRLIRGETRDRIRQTVAGADCGQLSLGPHSPSEDPVGVRVDGIQESAVGREVLVPQSGVRLDRGARSGASARCRCSASSAPNSGRRRWRTPKCHRSRRWSPAGNDHPR